MTRKLCAISEDEIARMLKGVAKAGLDVHSVTLKDERLTVVINGDDGDKSKVSFDGKDVDEGLLAEPTI